MIERQRGQKELLKDRALFIYFIGKVLMEFVGRELIVKKMRKTITQLGKQSSNMSRVPQVLTSELPPHN